MDVSNWRIGILGKTGVGKSSVADTIIGEKLFQIGHSVNSETSKCQAVTKSINGRNITLIDTPGFVYTDRSEKKLKSEIVRCITDFAPGPHAFLIVLKAERYTEHEQVVVTKIIQYFSEEVFKFATVLFTHGDQLLQRQTIEDFVRNNEPLSDLVKKCGGRCHVIDNKYWKNNQQDEYRSNQFQVEQLLKTIDTMVEANGGRCYTNEMLQAVEERIKQEMQLIRQSQENMPQKEIRELAIGRVSERLGKKLAGIATGALVGACFGVVVMVRVVLSVLEEVLPLVTNAAYLAVAPAVAAALTAETGGAAGKAAGRAAGIIAVKSLIALIVTSALVGAVTGGVGGYDAAKGADTLFTAVKSTAKLVFIGSKTTVDALNYCLRKES